MPTRNINLTEHDDQFVNEQVESGTYQDASEVLRAGLRLLEQQSQSEDEKLAILRKLTEEGFRSLDHGQGLSVSDEASLRNVISQIGQRAAASADVQKTQ